MHCHTYFEKVTSKPHVLWTVIMISIVLLPSRCYFFHNKVKLNAGRVANRDCSNPVGHPAVGPRAKAQKQNL